MSFDLEIFLMLGGVAFIVALLLSPVESLTWWAGWYGTREELKQLEIALDDTPTTDPQTVDAYIVYLTGIGGFSEKSFLPREQQLLKRLTAEFTHVKIVDDIYPYSVTNNGLIDHRLFARFWRVAVGLKERGSPLGFIINIRNILQIMVAADNRYGPIYAHGIARVVIEGLQRHHYPFGSGTPIYLVGYSGGGEMCISAVGPVKKFVKAPIYVISLGGVISNDPNIKDVDRLYHLYGNRDRVQLIGPIVFPGRWRIAHWSNWNQARRDGTIQNIKMGNMGHSGIGGYLDDTTYYRDEQTNLDYTISVFAGIIAGKYDPA